MLFRQLFDTVSSTYSYLLADERTRAEQFRLQEWALHEEMLQAAWAAAREVHNHPNRVSLHGLVKLYDLASVLGRRAVGLPLDYVQPKTDPPAQRPEVEEALRKVYGPPPGPADNPDPPGAVTRTFR